MKEPKKNTHSNQERTLDERADKCGSKQHQGCCESLGINEIAEILAMLDKHDVVEFEFEREQTKLRLKRSCATVLVDTNVVSRPVSSAAQFSSEVVTHSSNGSAVVAKNEQLQQSAMSRSSEVVSVTENGIASSAVSTSKTLKEVTSPMVGTFYRRPAVDAEPYVSQGDVVKKGTVLCIVEAMKIMNEIESDVAGRVVDICLEDGQMVEYGEVLFRVEPL